MEADSKKITSSQVGAHKNLEKIVRRHVSSAYRKPIAEHNQQAFAKAYQCWHDRGKPKVIVDSACGTAESSHFLAHASPNALVIGLDQSQHRLSKSHNQFLPGNLLLLRCDCTDFWRLAASNNWKIDHHYLLYPNPYPKPDQLQRRWHAHPAFPYLLDISRRIELRTNWYIFALEFCQAASIMDGKTELLSLEVSEPITAFERKYTNSGHQLWRVLVDAFGVTASVPARSPQ